MISKKDLYVYRGTERILLLTNDFVCLSPHPNLKKYISNYNITFPSKGLIPDGFTIIPCGCATLNIEKNTNGLTLYLEGPTTKSYHVGNQTNQTELLLTIEFKPGGLYTFTGINQDELADKIIPFETAAPRLNRLFSDTIDKAESIYELAASFDLILQKNIHTFYHPELLPSLQNIIDCSGNITIKKISEDIHYSERHINRIFKQHVGINAKSFSRLIRIHNTFELLKNPAFSLTLISDVTGFHDLSHFIRNFRSVCGVTPQEYRNNMSDFYINPIKF